MLKRPRIRGLLCALAALIATCALGGCGPSHSKTATSAGSTVASAEQNPAGDIPDTQVYVPFTMPDGVFTVSVPEGWARSTDGTAIVFTDKTNTVRLRSTTQPNPPTVDSVKNQVLPAIAGNTAGYQPGSVKVVQRKAGPAIRATYQAASPPNPVTGKTVTDDVQRYEFWRAGHLAVITLSGPVGADNVDPWNTITNSLQWK